MEQSLSQSATPGNISHISTHRLCNWVYPEGSVLTFTHLNENDTYVIILNLQASHYGIVGEGSGVNLYKQLKESPHIRIVWESEMAVNRRSGHGTAPRNKMIVFEYIANPDVQS